MHQEGTVREASGVLLKGPYTNTAKKLRRRRCIIRSVPFPASRIA